MIINFPAARGPADDIDHGSDICVTILGEIRATRGLPVAIQVCQGMLIATAAVLSRELGPAHVRRLFSHKDVLPPRRQR